MDPAVAAQHMKRCVASGLWVPEGGPQDPNTGLLNTAGEEGEDKDKVLEEEPIYQKVEDTVD